MKNYMPIIIEQLNTISCGDFLSSSENSLNICITYENKRDKVKLENNLIQKRNVRINYVGDVREFEYPTLKLLYHEAPKYENVGYIHTKGLTSGWHDWRRVMMRYVISEWDYCILLLKHIDICGYELLPISTLFKNLNRNLTAKERIEKFFYENSKFFYQGNFWWGKSLKILSLPNLSDTKYKSRYEAEMWIGLPSKIKSAYCLKYRKTYKVNE